MVSNCSRTIGLSRSATLSSSPKTSNWAMVGAMIGARYFPHGSPISVHTSIRTLSVSYPYVRALGLRRTDRAGPLRFAAGGDRPPGVGPRPTRDRDELVQHPALVLLRSTPVLPGVLLRDLKTRRHRQPLTHPPSTLQHP